MSGWDSVAIKKTQSYKTPLYMDGEIWISHYVDMSLNILLIYFELFKNGKAILS